MCAGVLQRPNIPASTLLSKKSLTVINVKPQAFLTIVAIRIAARKCSPRTLWQLSASSFCAAVVFVRSIFSLYTVKYYFASSFFLGVIACRLFYAKNE